MAVYERPVWQLMQEFADEHAGQFRFAELDSWFRRRYPAIQSSTLRAHLHRMTVDTNGTDDLPRLFVRVEHGLYRVSKPAENMPTDAAQVRVAVESESADILLMTCVKKKGPSPAPAKDLYISPLFQKQRAYAEQTGRPWFILSAEHGLVAPNEWLAPYERYLPDCPPSYRRAWGQWVAARLDLLHGGLSGTTIEVHASASYLAAIAPELHRLGASVTNPLSGLSVGERLAWYREPAVTESPVEPPPATLPTLSKAPERPVVARLIVELSDITNALRPVDLRALGRKGLSRAGLYAWWVDVEGAEDLSGGLGSVVRPGLIYAGQAGATRWPSGGRSKNTLWARLIGMHLDGPASFSTFRLTLGSILLEPLGLQSVDDPALSEWIQSHLRVVAVAVEDADALKHIEQQVLQHLDPPLNLMSMDPTPVRLRLSELRRSGGRGSEH